MIKVERLMDRNDTLYGIDPKLVAATLKDKLNKLEEFFDILDVMALPDYHHFSEDGGNKDIFILTTEKRPGSSRLHWHTDLLRGENTMHGWETPRIQELLEIKLGYLAGRDFDVKHLVAITDNHSSITFQGKIGLDGLKDMILCYHPRANLPQG